MTDALEFAPKGKINQVEKTGETKPAQDGFFTDIARHLAYSAIQKPVTGVSQIVDSVAGTHLAQSTEMISAPQDAQFGSVRWHVEEVASGVGAALPYLAAMAITRPVMRAATTNSLVSMAGETAFKSASTYRTAEAAAAGFVNGALFEPSNDDSSILAQRLKQGTVSGVTMGAMHSLSNKLNEKTQELPFASGVVSRAFTTATAGFGAGIIGATTDAVVNQKPIEFSDLYKSAYAMAFTGATLGLVSDSYLKLHQPKSSFPDTGSFVAGGKSSGTMFDNGMREILRNNFSGRAKGFVEDMIERIKQSTSKNTGGKTGESSDLPEQSSSKPALEGPSVLSKMSPVERAEFIATLEHQADSKLLSEPNLNKLIDKLAGSVDNWSKDNIQQYEDRFAAAQKAVIDKYDARDRIVDEASRRPQIVKHRDDGSFAFSIDDHEDVRDAREELERVVLLRNLRANELDAVRQRRTDDISHGINEFLADHNLPPVKLGTTEQANASAAYGRGNLVIHASLLKSSEFTATQFGLIIHELTHLEQDVLRVRAIADAMGIDKITDETVTALRDKAEQFGIGQSSDADLDPDSEFKTPKSFIENILRIRNNEHLSPEEQRKAYRIVLATVVYAAPPYIEKQNKLLDQFVNLSAIVEKKDSYHTGLLLDRVINEPEKVPELYGFPRIPNELKLLAQKYAALRTGPHDSDSQIFDAPDLEMPFESKGVQGSDSELVSEILERWLSSQANGQNATNEPANAHEYDYVVDKAASILSNKHRKIENQLANYARKDYRWYYDNELERQAQPAGTLAYLLAESRGLHTGE